MYHKSMAKLDMVKKRSRNKVIPSLYHGKIWKYNNNSIEAPSHSLEQLRRRTNMGGVLP